MQPKDLEARVTALENDVAELRGQVQASREDSAAARVLAGGADRDVGELGKEMRDFRRATISSFNALRQDMNDRFRRVDERFDRVDERFEMIAEKFEIVEQKFSLVDNGFAEMRAKFDMTAAGQQRIVDLIQVVIDAQGDKDDDNPSA